MHKPRGAGLSPRGTLVPRFAAPVVAVLLFSLAGLAFIRKTGIHFDAAYELAAFYPCSTPAFRPTILGHPFPLMVIQYLGAFKAWLYLPILQYLEVTPVTLRLPLLITGALSVWLSFAILDRIGGRRAAIAGSLLLATDATFVIASTYDFGPIVFLHFFLLAGILLLLRFNRTGKARDLALAFLLFGLALWHKALFIWMFDGLSAAGLILFHKRILALFSWKRLAVAGVSMCIGAFPLIYYNAVTHGATLHPEKVMSGNAPLSQKLLVLRKTLNGSVLFAWLTDYTPNNELPPHHLGSRISVRLSRWITVRSNWMLYAFLASCCLMPWLWFTPARTPSLFVLIYLLVTWGQMAILPNAGGTLHHVILLWPFPHFLIALAGAQLSYGLGRYGAPATAAALIAIIGCNLLLVNQYYADLVTDGTTVIWTDAIYPLYEYLDENFGPRIVTTDWGYSATLCLLSDGELPLVDISYAMLDPSEKKDQWVLSLIANRRTLFVGHTSGGEQFAGVQERVAAVAARAGYTKQVVKIIADRNRRPRFEIARYVAGQ